MMITVAILALIVSLVLGILQMMAYALSDNPMGPQPRLVPMWVGLAISAALFVCWRLGWHPSW